MRRICLLLLILFSLQAFAEPFEQTQKIQAGEETCDSSNANTGYLHCRPRTTTEIFTFYVSTTLSGMDLATYSVSIFDDKMAEKGLTKLSGAVLGIGGVMMLDLTGEPMPYGLPSAISMGTSFGLLLAYPQIILLPTIDESLADSTSITSGIRLTAMLLGGTGGYFLGKAKDLSPGQSTAIQVGSFWGFGLGAFTGLMSVAYRHLRDQSLDKMETRRLFWGLMSLGTVGGATGGYFLGQQSQPSSLRLWVTTAGGIAGVVAGYVVDTVVSAIRDKNSLPMFATYVGLGSLGGLALTWYLTRNFEPDLPSCSRSVQFGFFPIEKGAMAGVSGIF